MPTMTLDIPAEIGAQLDALAQAQGSSSRDIALQAIRAFLAEESDRQLTVEAIAELDRGEGLPAEQVREEMIALLEQHGIGRARQAVIRRQVATDLGPE